MPGYMLLLHNPTDENTGLSAEEIQSVIEDYMAWRDTIASEDRLLGGDKLTDEGGRHLKNENGAIRITDGPYAEVKEALGGYFSIKAANYEEAAAIAKTCPHLKYGGWIELRQIDEH